MGNPLACDEEQSPIEGGQSYPVWSPERAFDAAAALMKALQDEGRSACSGQAMGGSAAHAV
jgi:hypothetical protein